MRFAQVTGMLYALDSGYRIVVTIDTTSEIQTVRDEHLPYLLVHNGKLSAEWTVDQLTQETIGTTLAELGWEALAFQPQPDTNEWAPPMAAYLVRGQ